MTYNVFSGTLNPTHLLTHSTTNIILITYNWSLLSVCLTLYHCQSQVFLKHDGMYEAGIMYRLILDLTLTVDGLDRWNT